MIRRSVTIALLALASVLGAGEAMGQLATLRGRVVEAETGEPLPGASVLVSDRAGAQRGTSADPDGRFEMLRLPPGTYTIAVSFVGFSSQSDTLDIGFGTVVQIEIRMESEEGTLDEILIEEDQSSAPLAASADAIRPAALARVPMPDVTYDLAGYLLTLPGFVSTGDRGGQLFVRGGTPTQNLVLIDGIPILQPFHIVGFYSAFPADIVSWADVYAGGYSARYGGRISAVVDVWTKNGDKRRVRAAGSVAPFLTSLRAEIPLSTNKVSLVTSIRESVIERVAPDLLGRSLPFRFGDQFAKLHAFLSPTSSFSTTLIHTYDEGALGDPDSDDTPSGESPAEWANTAVGWRYTYLPSEASTVAQFSGYYSRLVSRYRPLARRPQESDVRSVTMAVDFVYLLGWSRVHLGLFGNMHQFVYDLGNRYGEVRSGITSGGMFIDTRFDLGENVRLEPGIRMEEFSQGVEASLDPRFRMTVISMNGHQQWTLALGRYRQQIVGVSNEQDISDVFSVWTASPRATPVPQADHFLVGVTQRLSPGIEFAVDAYHKDLRNLTFPVFGDEPRHSGRFSLAEGDVSGVEVRTEVTGRWTWLSVSYSLADVEYRWTGLPPGGHEIVGLETVDPPNLDPFDPPHDRRHQVNAMGQLSRGPWRLSMRWQFGSGLPYTKINGFYEGVSVKPATDWATDPGVMFVSRGSTLDSRLPAYHRLDLSLERDFRFRTVKVTAQAGVLNLYDRANLFEYNFIAGKRIDQLPLVPSVGLNVEIR